MLSFGLREGGDADAVRRVFITCLCGFAGVMKVYFGLKLFYESVEMVLMVMEKWKRVW